MRLKKSAFAFLLACMILLSSCKSGDGNAPEPTATASDIIAAEDTEAADNTEITVSMTGSAADTEDTTDASEEDTAENSGTEASEEDVTEKTSHTGTTENEAPPAVTAGSNASVTTTAPPVTTTTVTTTAKPAAPVVIPEIKMPESPGTKTITGTNAEVDYSNAAEGYISVLYSGSADGGKVRLKCGSVQYDHDLTAGKREYFPLMDSGSYSVKVYEHVTGSNYAQIIDDSFDVTIKSTTGMYLYPNKYINFSSSSACVKKAAELCAGETDDVEKIASIFTYLTDTITYDKQLAATVKSGYVPDPDSTLSSKKGICFDYASLFAAMCRSQGIPARLVIGYAEPDIYHAWNEVYTDETGWITPELFLKKKGYNIADATFYASNSDKDKIAAYISNDGNYSAMYRY